jgi:hypothetical protein
MDTGCCAAWLPVTLRDQSQLDANTASQQGGGICLEGGGLLALHDQSAVTGNQADLTDPTSGGGIVAAGIIVEIDPQATVSGNTPDNCSPSVGACT